MRLLAKIVVPALIVSGLTVGTQVAADAAQKCQKGSNTSSGRCWSTGKVTKKSTVVESVPLVNKSSKTVKMHCSFSQTITREVSVGADVGVEVKATLFHLVDATTSIHVQTSVKQSAAAAVEAGGEITLKPGQSVTCERTYGYVTTRIKDYTWYDGGKKSTTVYYKIKVPSALGVTIVD